MELRVTTRGKSQSIFLATGRGRNLTEAEKMQNLMGAIAEFEREEAARVNSLKEENQNDLP